MVLDMHSPPLFTLYGRRRKTAHMAQVFPTGDAISKRVGRIFKFNGAGEFVFPKIIKSLPIPALCFNSLAGYSPKHWPPMGFSTFSWEYIENISAFQGLCCSSFNVVKSFSVKNKAILHKQEALMDHYWADKGINLSN